MRYHRLKPRKPVTMRTYCASCDQYKYCQVTRNAWLCIGVEGCATMVQAVTAAQR